MASAPSTVAHEVHPQDTVSDGPRFHLHSGGRAAGSPACNARAIRS